MKIDLPLDWRDVPAPVVRAELVPEIAPHLASVFTPAVHRAPPGMQHWGAWQVSDVETGQRVGRSYSTRCKCLINVAVYLGDKTVADITKAHRRYRSPR